MPFLSKFKSFGDELIKVIDIKSLFISNREDVLSLTERIFQRCILEKTMPRLPP